MTLEQRLAALATRVGGEAKALRTLVNGNAADLAALTTTAKNNLVAAINELKAAVAAAGSAPEVNDAVTNLVNTWSSQKISDTVTAAINALAAGAPAALNSIDELAAALQDDANVVTNILTALGNRVRTDVNNQGLAAPQQQNARTNINAYGSTELGNPDADHVATFNAALV
jgi:hypothetical protein